MRTNNNFDLDANLNIQYTMSDSGVLIYRHGRFRVEGGVLPEAITAYRTYGDHTKPCIVFPTCYGGKLESAYTSITIAVQDFCALW